MIMAYCCHWNLSITLIILILATSTVQPDAVHNALSSKSMNQDPSHESPMLLMTPKSEGKISAKNGLIINEDQSPKDPEKENEEISDATISVDPEITTQKEEEDEETSLVLRIFDYSQLVMTIIGVIANMITVVTLCLNGSSFSPIILILLRHQSLIDAWICLQGAIFLVQPYMWLPGNTIGDIIVCHVWHSQTIYWVSVTISIYNLVSIAFERYVTVCHPFKHMEITPKMIYLLILGIYIFNSLAVSPAYLQVMIEENGTCVSEYKVPGDKGILLFKIFSVYYFILFYAIPTVLFFVFYGFVIGTFRKRKKQTELAASHIIDTATKELTKTAVVVTIIFILAMGYDFWYYLLGYLEVVEYKMNSALQKVGVWLSAFNSTANPFVYAILMPVYWKSIKKTFTCSFRKKEEPRGEIYSTPSSTSVYVF